MTQQPAAAVAGAPRAGTASRASVPVVGSARLTMWLLMLLPWLACHCVRKGLPILIEFICQDLGYGEMQKAQLLGAFFPGCAPVFFHIANRPSTLLMMF